MKKIKIVPKGAIFFVIIPSISKFALLEILLFLIRSDVRDEQEGADYEEKRGYNIAVHGVLLEKRGQRPRTNRDDPNYLLYTFCVKKSREDALFFG